MGPPLASPPLQSFFFIKLVQSYIYFYKNNKDKTYFKLKSLEIVIYFKNNAIYIQVFSQNISVVQEYKIIIFNKYIE